MGFFDDYDAAVDAYPNSDVRLEIRNVGFPGIQLNVDEEGTFEVLIRNEGPVRLTDVALRVRGLNGVLVKHRGALSQFGPEMQLDGAGGRPISVEPSGGTFLIAPGSDDWSQTLAFRAPSTPRREQELLEVSMMNWAVDLSPLQSSHGWSAAATTYVDRIRAA